MARIIETMNNIAIVPARSGSKGFVHKNIAKIGGRTLIELAVNIGLEASLVDTVYVSTDSAEYEALALQIGGTSLGLRDPSLASDTAKSVDVVMDLIDRLPAKPDNVVLLQPTSPVRKPEDIDECLRKLEDSLAVVSVSLLEEPSPYKTKKINRDGWIVPLLDGSDSEVPRQLQPETYMLNGCIYAIRVSALEKYRTFFPPKTSPYIMDHSFNIDKEIDLEFLSYLLERKKVTVYGIDAQ